MIKSFRRFIVKNFSFLPRLYMKIMRYLVKQKEVRNAYCALRDKADSNTVVAVIGVNKYSEWFIRRIRKLPVIFWGGQ